MKSVVDTYEVRDQEFGRLGHDVAPQQNSQIAIRRSSPAIFGLRRPPMLGFTSI